MAKAQRPPILKATQKIIRDKNLNVCCVCKERGIGTNLHHIDGNPSNNGEDNIALLCVKEHDQHHRPNVYDKTKHIELGQDKIITYKKEWEEAVSECKSDNPKVITVVNVYGTYDNLHSVRFFLQNRDSKIIYERIYHLLTGTPDQWTDAIIEEVVWLGKNVKLTLIDKPLAVEYCPCCSTSLSNVLDKNVMVHLTASDWEETSIGSVYINPEIPSLALTIFYNDDLVFTAHLHKCNQHLHFRCDNYEERTPLKKHPSIRTQATELIQRVIQTWEIKNLFIGTGDPDTPTIIDNFNLPTVWETI